MLTIDNMSLNYHGNNSTKPILKPFDLTLKSGEVTALIGGSGAGKSMLALALMQLLPSNIRMGQGSQVVLGGQSLIGLSEAKYTHIRGARLAMVFQEPMTALNPVGTVGAQIRECLSGQQLSLRQKRIRVLELLSAVEFSDPKLIAQSYPHQLSGGMRQRVVIAIALAQQPEVLIADEPTTALDASLQGEILDLLVRLVRERNMALLLISHDLTLIKRYANHMALLYEGQLVEVIAKIYPKDIDGVGLVHPYAQLLQNAVPSEAKRLFRLPESVFDSSMSRSGCSFAPHCPLVLPACTETLPALAHVDAYHLLRCIRPGVEIPKPEQFALQPAVFVNAETRALPPAPTITLVDVWARHPKQKQNALKGISLTMHPGKTLAIVGDSGSGKSTLAKVLSGLLKPTRGEILVDGQSMHAFKPNDWQQFRRQVQWVLQDPFGAFDPRWRVDAILAEGVLANTKPRPTLEDLRASQIILLEQVGLSADMLTRYPHEFSGGQRQRLAIARALAVNPRVIICDEPTSALDVLVQAQILNLLRDLQQRFQLSYCLISHNMDVVDYMADDICVLNQGEILR